MAILWQIALRARLLLVAEDEGRAEARRQLQRSLRDLDGAEPGWFDPARVASSNERKGKRR
jgi:hypothetical protein